MNRMKLILIAIIISPVIALGQLYPENIFGLDLPVARWNHTTDQQFFSSAFDERLFCPLDIASIRFERGDSLSEVYLLVENLGAKIRWLRVCDFGGNRSVESQGYLGHFGDGTGEFRAPSAITVTSGSRYFNPDFDHIFVADRTNNRVVKLNYDYHPGAPSSDQLL